MFSGKLKRMITPAKKWLFEHEKSVRWLAEACGGADETGLGQIVNGKRKPSLILAMKIARVLDTPVEILFGYLLEESLNE